MALEETACVAMCSAHEQQVNLLKWKLVGKHKVCITEQTGVYIGNAVAGIALAVDEFYFNFGILQKYFFSKSI